MHLRYSKVRLEAKVHDGSTAYCEIPFTTGGNLILTDSNTQGKSTVINALAVGLGFDDLVKSNVAALVKDSIKIRGQDRRITNAAIVLEIANAQNEFLTVRRSVKPELSKGMLVHRGIMDEWNEQAAEEYYLGSGSYTDTKGFHRALSEFIGFPDVKVISQDDRVMRLYLEYIFSAIFIEQKRGWADIMANMPYYRVRDPKKSTIAELLGMDYIRYSLRRNELRLDEQRLKAEYQAGAELIKRNIAKSYFSISGVPSEPGAGSWSPLIFRARKGEEDQSLTQLLVATQATLADKQREMEVPPSDPALQERLDEIADRITTLSYKKAQLDSAIATKRANLRRYRQRLEELGLDLNKNKEELRIRKLFGKDGWSAKQACPVCEHPVDGTLLSQLRSFPTMSIEDNVEYIADQKSLLEDVSVVEAAARDRASVESQRLGGEIGAALMQHSEIQRSLTSSVPAELLAKAREIARLEQEIEKYGELSDTAVVELAALEKTYRDYEQTDAELKNLSGDLSSSDRALLKAFQDTFREFLKVLGFNSFEISSMIIDEALFSPRVIINNLDQRKRIRADFGSSASDWIRIITAFVLALHASRANSENSNHPNVTVLDEPAQQNIDRQDYLRFFEIVAHVCKGGGQVIVAATDKDHAVREKAKSLGMNVIDFGSNYILQQRQA